MCVALAFAAASMCRAILMLFSKSAMLRRSPLGWLLFWINYENDESNMLRDSGIYVRYQLLERKAMI
jgi:hypothetical protein